MKKQLKVLFLWHMHQPSYVDPQSNTSLMPWVRLHAIKDYYDMGQIVESVTNAKAVFNFVPSLWEQLQKISSGELLDQHEIISRKPAETLSDEEKLFVAEHFFSCHFPSMIEPYPTYKELYLRFGAAESSLILNADLQTLIDLQVWFHLTWSGNTLRRDKFVKYLFNKAHGFSHEEKLKLLDLQREFIGSIVDFYKNMAKSGKVEISTTPYYHPILPLLLDPDSASVAMPQAKLPEGRHALARDAEYHVKSAIDLHKSLFGQEPNGFWPAEGSISSLAAKMFGNLGVKWIASDEENLRISLGKSVLSSDEKFQIYSHEGVNIFFRDHGLSDRIGFIYQNYSTEDAVADFVSLLHGIRDSLTDCENNIVPVILDGENCWEFYENHGEPFLRGVYQAIVDDDKLDLVTCSEAIKSQSKITKLDKLHSGSWIDANFSTWVGDEIKNRAWSYFYSARKQAEKVLKAGNLSDSQTALLMENIYAAEGSDWFWWFGEGHSSDYDIMFDKLFRKRLKGIYRLIEIDPPSYLMHPIDENLGEHARYTLPAFMIRPEINGQASSYWEWLNAGSYFPAGGSMQRSNVLVDSLKFGFDTDALYFRMESSSLLEQENLSGYKLEIAFPDMQEKVFEIDFSLKANQTKRISYAIGDLIEAKIPFSALIKSEENGVEDRIEFYLSLKQNDKELERIPGDVSIYLPYPKISFDDENWFI